MYHTQGKSHVSSNCCLKDVALKEHNMESDEIPDTPFEVEEVEHVLKSQQARGPDSLSPEHIKFTGPEFVSSYWLCQVLNHICELWQIPPCFKQGIIIPAFKGKGCDPLLIKSYRGNYDVCTCQDL